MYFGSFPKLQPSVIAWRVNKLVEILNERTNGVELRVKIGFVTPGQRDLLLELRRTMEIWILANSAEEREMVLKLLAGCSATVSVFTVSDVSDEVSKSGMY
jgi:hypothetical protein